MRTFESPEYRGKPLPYCSSDGSLCGADFARDWCVQNGFERVSNWTLMENAGVISSPSSRANNRNGFSTITCAREGSSFRAPRLGSLVRSTVIAPDRRASSAAIAPVEFHVTLPGCTQREPGVFLCESIHDYQMCRSLHQSGQVYGCRAGVAFASGFAKPVSVSAHHADLSVESNAAATVHLNRRGRGKLRGGAEFELLLPLPQVSREKLCLQRDRYIYYPTGPMGGMSGIEQTGRCDEPLQGEFEPHEDDLLRAYDTCAAENAWGGTVEQPIEVLVAGLFHFVDADIAGTLKGATVAPDILAPYTTVSAPMRVKCEL
ncbi:MAG: hypothetical protein PVF50_00440 [Gammaproteobacteria bacterium]